MENQSLCPKCGRDFCRLRGKVYCSEQCRKKAERIRWKKRKAQQVANQRKQRVDTCIGCDSIFQIKDARGARKFCYSCRPDRGNGGLLCTCVDCGATWRPTRPARRCGRCHHVNAGKKRNARQMNAYRHRLKMLATEAKRRQRKAAKFIYLEGRCVVCSYPTWRDAVGVGKGVRTCGTATCQLKYSRRLESTKDSDAQRNHRRRTAARAGDDIRKSQVWKRDGGVCHLCGLPADIRAWHLDHVLPLSQGGTHTWDNVAVSHPACNLSKGATPPAELRLPL